MSTASDQFNEAFKHLLAESLLSALRSVGFRPELATPETLHRKHWYSQARLAAAVGTSRSTIYRIENNPPRNMEDSTIAVCKRIAAEIGEPEELYLEAVQRHCIQRNWRHSWQKRKSLSR